MTSKAKAAQIKHLTEALNRANEAAKLAGEANPDDGGTCNFDSVVIRLPRWTPEEIAQVHEGTTARISDHVLSGWFRGYRFVTTTTGGQGALRSRMMGAALESLKAETPEIDVRGYYQAD